MAPVSDTLTIETVRESDDAYRFALVADRAGVTARSTSTYASQANAVSAASRMTDGAQVGAEVAEREGGWAVRLVGATLEAVTAAWPDRAQAETALGDLTG